MTEQQEMFLKSLFDTGASIYWSPDCDGDERIVSIRMFENEFALCAFFSDGKYVALYNEEISNFNIVTKINLAELFNNQLEDAT